MEPVTATVPLDRFPGKVLDGFLIEAPLGRGGMSAVFRGRDIALNRPVAIKVMLSGAVRDAATRARFLSEARAAASLVHPNVVQTYRTGETAGVLYIAMQYVNGQTLDKVLKRDGRFAPKRALAIAREVCSALEAAHKAGLVHRDIKPANIVIGPDGHVTVMDFGVAKPMRGELADANEFAGTPEYASPEQHGTGPVDARSDLYSVGVMLYQMLTGKLPFVSETETTLRRRIMEETEIPVRDLAPGIPLPVAMLVARLMAKNPAKRPASAKEAISEMVAARRIAKLKWPAVAAAASLLIALAAVASEKIRAWRPAEGVFARPVATSGAGSAVSPEAPKKHDVSTIPDENLPTILVAEFAGPKEDSDWLPAALADLLSREIAESGKFHVLPRSHTAREIAMADDPAAAAEQAAPAIGASAIVVGHYSFVGDRLQVQVEIVRMTPDGPVRQPLQAVGMRREFTRLTGPLAESIVHALETPVKKEPSGS